MFSVFLLFIKATRTLKSCVQNDYISEKVEGQFQNK